MPFVVAGEEGLLSTFKSWREKCVMHLHQQYCDVEKKVATTCDDT